MCQSLNARDHGYIDCRTTLSENNTWQVLKRNNIARKDDNGMFSLQKTEFQECVEQCMISCFQLC